MQYFRYIDHSGRSSSGPAFILKLGHLYHEMGHGMYHVHSPSQENQDIFWTKLDQLGLHDEQKEEFATRFASIQIFDGATKTDYTILTEQSKAVLALIKQYLVTKRPTTQELDYAQKRALHHATMTDIEAQEIIEAQDREFLRRRNERNN